MKKKILFILIITIILCIIYVYQTQNINNTLCIDKTILVDNFITTQEKNDPININARINNNIYNLTVLAEEEALRNPPAKLKLKSFLGLTGVYCFGAYVAIVTVAKIKASLFIYGVWNPDPLTLLATVIVVGVMVTASIPVSLYAWSWMDIESMIYLSDKWALEQKTADDLLAEQNHRRFLKDFLRFIYESVDDDDDINDTKK